GHLEGTGVVPVPLRGGFDGGGLVGGGLGTGRLGGHGVGWKKGPESLPQCIVAVIRDRFRPESRQRSAHTPAAWATIPPDPARGRPMHVPPSRFRRFRAPAFWLCLALVTGIGLASVAGVRSLQRSS